MSRPRHSLLALAIVALVASACGGSAAPTASPTPLPASASPTSSPAPEATASTTATPTAGPTLIPYPGPSIPPGTLTIQIAAVYSLQFDRTDLDAPAGTPFVIHFENQDHTGGGQYEVAAAHNVAIKLGSTLLFNPLPAIVFPVTADYFISDGLPAGTYTFLCTVHPFMHGTLTIQ